MKVIRLPCYDIVVTLDDHGSGHLRSNLNEDCVEGDEPIDTAFDAIESLILAHACAGVDITARAYVEGVETAVEAATNNLT